MMAEIDIFNDILSCVSNGLDSVFPNIPAFSDTIPNDIPSECFLLDFAGDPEIKKELGHRYKVSGSIDIAYLVPENKILEAKPRFTTIFAEISLRLQHLSYRNINIRLFSHKMQIADGVLHDICVFTTYLNRINNAPVISHVIPNPVGIQSSEED